jgi:hypothetical protein
MSAIFFNTKRPLIIDTEMANKKVYCYSTDTEETYRKNIRANGNDWRWKNKTIEYKFNSLGYRSKEIDEVSDNFILGFGCSFTEGVGIEEQDTWISKVAKYLRMDYVNLGKQATGMDIQCYNALMYKNSELRLPKLVIIQWPQMFRLSFGVTSNQDTALIDQSYTSNADGKWWTKRYIQDVGHMKINVLNWYHSFNYTWQSLGIPVINFSWEHDIYEEISYSKIPMYFVDPQGIGSMQARDGIHDAPEFHTATVEKLNKLNAL